ASLEKVIEAGKSLAPKNAAYNKALAAAEAGAKKTRAAIDRRRVALVVDAHRATLDPAERAVTEKLAALDPKSKPDAADFAAAEGAVKALGDALESGGEAAGKDPAYAKRIAALKGRLDGFSATIAKRKTEGEVAAAREKLGEASSAASGAIAGLAKADD